MKKIIIIGCGGHTNSCIEIIEQSKEFKIYGLVCEKKIKQFDKYKMYLGITILCALGFLVVKYFEYTGKFHHDIYPSTSTFMGIYFTLTGLHVLHIIGGVLVLSFYMTKQADKMWAHNKDLLANRIEVTGLYWHFVDLVWIFLFPILYLL